MIAKPLLAALCATAALLATAPAALAEGEVTVVVHGKGDVTAPGITCNETGGSVCSQRYFDVDREVCNKNDPTDCIKTLRQCDEITLPYVSLPLTR